MNGEEEECTKNTNDENGYKKGIQMKEMDF